MSIKAGYFGSEVACVPGGMRTVEKGLGLADLALCDLSLEELRKKRQSQTWQRNGRTDSLAKNASKKPRVLDLRVRSLWHHGQRNGMTEPLQNEWLRGKQRAVPARALRSLEESRLYALLACPQSRIDAFRSIP